METKMHAFYFLGQSLLLLPQQNIALGGSSEVFKMFQIIRTP